MDYTINPDDYMKLKSQEHKVNHPILDRETMSALYGFNISQNILPVAAKKLEDEFHNSMTTKNGILYW